MVVSDGPWVFSHFAASEVKIMAFQGQSLKKKNIYLGSDEGGRGAEWRPDAGAGASR